MTNNDPWARVASYAALYEAEMAQGRLDSVGIPSRVDQQGAVGMFGPGHQGASVRGVVLFVPRERVAEARNALDLE